VRRLALLGMVLAVTALACGGGDGGAAGGEVDLEPVDESGETTTEATETTETTVAAEDEVPDEGEIRACLGAAGVELSGPDEELPPLSASVAIGVLPGQGSFDPGGFVGVIFLFASENEAQAVANTETFAGPSTFVSGSILVALDGSEAPEVRAALEDCTG
jgi:hypothetical protein